MYLQGIASAQLALGATAWQNMAMTEDEGEKTQ
jgi:hypothetical protein